MTPPMIPSSQPPSVPASCPHGVASSAPRCRDRPIGQGAREGLAARRARFPFARQVPDRRPFLRAPAPPACSIPCSSCQNARPASLTTSPSVLDGVQVLTARQGTLEIVSLLAHRARGPPAGVLAGDRRDGHHAETGAVRAHPARDHEVQTMRGRQRPEETVQGLRRSVRLGPRPEEVMRQLQVAGAGRRREGSSPPAWTGTLHAPPGGPPQLLSR